MDMLNKIRALGCSNEANIMMAYQTFLELTRMEQYVNVTCLYDNELDILYLEGLKGNVQSIFLPIHSSFIMSLTWIRTVRDRLCHGDQKSVVLIIRDADSSSVRYKLTEGLILPPNESNRHLRKGGGKSTKKQKLSSSDSATTCEQVG